MSAGKELDAKLKHLEFIQGVITRLASASFQMKGWSVVIVSAFLVFGIQIGSFWPSLVSLIPVLAFWALDGYFLSRERLFQKLYDRVRVDQGRETDFSMDVAGLERPGRFWSGDWWSAIRSLTLCLFYGVFVLTVLAVAIVDFMASG